MGQPAYAGEENTDGRPLTRETRTRRRVLEENTGGGLPSFPCLSPFYPQLRRRIALASLAGATARLVLRRYPLPPRRPRRAFAPLTLAHPDHQRLTLRPKENTGGCRPSFSLDTFPPPGDAATQMVRPVCACRCSTTAPPACHAHHLPHAAQETGYACVTASVDRFDF